MEKCVLTTTQSWLRLSCKRSTVQNDEFTKRPKVVLKPGVDKLNKPCMEADLSLLVHVAQHSALPDRTVCGFRRSNCQQSAVERFPKNKQWKINNYY